MAQRIGVVLAGGFGTRFGAPKGEVTLGGTTLAERAARSLRPICGNVLISLPRGKRNPAPSYDVVEDEPPPGRGPLAGIASAFASTGKADLLVLACDYPGAGTPLLRFVAESAGPDADLVVPVDADGRDHPLVALWRRSAEGAVRQALADGALKVQSLFPDLEVTRLHPASLEAAGLDPRRSLRNVNWPEDLAPFEVEEP